MSPIELAQEFEDAIGRLWNGYGYVWSGFTEASCNAIRHPDVHFLVRNEMFDNSEYFTCYSPEFGVRHGPKRQYARALWLTLLAELAERGDLTLEGLK